MSVNDTNRAFGIADICARTGLGRTLIYLAIQSGALKARKCGRRTVVLADDFQAWLAHLPTKSSRAGTRS
jgi:Helix-turn-helix domain